MLNLQFRNTASRQGREVATHYIDIIMTMMAAQITSLTIVFSIVFSGADQRKHQNSASLAFVRGIHRGPVNSPHKWPITRKMFPFDDVIMNGDFRISQTYVSWVFKRPTTTKLWSKCICDIGQQNVDPSCGFERKMIMLFASHIIPVGSYGACSLNPSALPCTLRLVLTWQFKDQVSTIRSLHRKG